MALLGCVCVCVCVWLGVFVCKTKKKRNKNVWKNFEKKADSGNGEENGNEKPGIFSFLWEKVLGWCYCMCYCMSLCIYACIMCVVCVCVCVCKQWLQNDWWIHRMTVTKKRKKILRLWGHRVNHLFGQAKYIRQRHKQQLVLQQIKQLC